MNAHAKDFDSGAARLAELTEIITGQIRGLELHSEGVLTHEEFTTKKTELLSRL